VINRALQPPESRTIRGYACQRSRVQIRDGTENHSMQHRVAFCQPVRGDSHARQLRPHHKRQRRLLHDFEITRVNGLEPLDRLVREVAKLPSSSKSSTPSNFQVPTCLLTPPNKPCKTKQQSATAALHAWSHSLDWELTRGYFTGLWVGGLRPPEPTPHSL